MNKVYCIQLSHHPKRMYNANSQVYDALYGYDVRTITSSLFCLNPVHSFLMSTTIKTENIGIPYLVERNW